MSQKVDLLAIGVHPDDVELGCAGTILKHIHQGKKVAILDLTEGELGSRGSRETRKKEAASAADILGVSHRNILDFGDGFFTHSRENVLEIVKYIRLHQPQIVLANALADRHPDHGRAGKLIADACFYAGLVKIETAFNGEAQKPHRPQAVYHYVQDYYAEPNVVVDVSEFWDQKLASIRAYSTQFYNPESNEPQTPISSKEFLDFLAGRAAQYGRLIGGAYGEGFVTARPMGVHSLFDLL